MIEIAIGKAYFNGSFSYLFTMIASGCFMLKITTKNMTSNLM